MSPAPATGAAATMTLAAVTVTTTAWTEPMASLPTVEHMCFARLAAEVICQPPSHQAAEVHSKPQMAVLQLQAWPDLHALEEILKAHGDQVDFDGCKENLISSNLDLTGQFEGFQTVCYDF